MAVTFHFDDLKKYTDSLKGRVGAWYIGVQVHDGHKYLLDQLRTKVDHVIGIYYVNFFRHMEYVFGGRTIQSMAHAFEKEWYVDENTLNEIGDLTDFVFVSTGDHNPLKMIDINDIYYQLPNRKVPKYIRKDVHWHALLRVGQAIIKLMNEHNIYQYQMGCIKDCWKPYQKIWSDKYTNIQYDLIEPLNDEFGNNISNSKQGFPKFDRPILEPWMKNIKQANKNIADIDGLEFTSFARDKKLKRIYARLQYQDVFCNEGIKYG